MKKYHYFGADKNGAMVQIFEAVAEVEPTPAEINGIYLQVVRQAGLGVPRPSHFIALELTEIEQTEEIDDKPLILHSENGNGNGNGMLN